MQSITLGRRARRLATLAAVTASFAVVPAVVPESPVVSQASAASCSYAKVGGQRKCLQRGQFCAPRYQSDYRRAGFVCKSDGKGYNRLR
jgi:hypothetical protein